MSRFPEIADVSFMGNVTVAELKQRGIDEYIAAYKDITGEDITAAEIPDEIKSIIYTECQLDYQLMEVFDKKARQNLLKYAEGDYLDNLAAKKPLDRKQAEFSVVTERFELSAARQRVVAIPAGTRVTNSAAKIYFEVIDYTEIAPGDTSADIQCRAMTGGAAGNEFEIGEINILVDPIAYVAKVSNIDKPTGGADEESDDDFANRVYQARMLYSTAGSEEAYKYYTKSYSTLIDDVFPTNPRDAEIVIYITMKDRELANQSFLEDCQDFLCNPNIRPLTDKISVKNVERVNYDINVEYTIYDTDASRLADINKAVAAAVDKYKEWQSAKIGRDINTQELIAQMKLAGAAKVTVTSPQDKTVTKEQIAYCTDVNISYNGTIEE